jgi:hypothetical protein
MPLDLGSIGNWLKILEQLQNGGTRGVAVLNTFRSALAEQGFAADTAALDVVIANATRREALARREAAGEASDSDA